MTDLSNVGDIYKIQDLEEKLSELGTVCESARPDFKMAMKEIAQAVKSLGDKALVEEALGWCKHHYEWVIRYQKREIEVRTEPEVVGFFTKLPPR